MRVKCHSTGLLESSRKSTKERLPSEEQVDYSVVPGVALLEGAPLAPTHGCNLLLVKGARGSSSFTSHPQKHKHLEINSSGAGNDAKTAFVNTDRQTQKSHPSINEHESLKDLNIYKSESLLDFL